MSSALRVVPAQAWLISAYSVLALFAANLGQVRPSIAFRPLIVCLVGTSVAYLVLLVIFKEPARASLLTAYGAILFFSYGHVYNSLSVAEFTGVTLGRHRYLVPVWILAGLIGLWLFVKATEKPAVWNRRVGYALLIAVFLPAGQLLWAQLRQYPANSAGRINTSPYGLSSDTVDASVKPDVYYIVLDAYARADTLETSYGFDNTPFLDHLKEMGFYVATCSQANYAQTELSLASALNSLYLEDLLPDSPRLRSQLWPLIRGSEVRRTLEDLGYRTIAFETGYLWSELEDAHIYLAPRQGLLSGMTAFEGTLLRSTFAWAVLDNWPYLFEAVLQDADQSADTHRERVRFILDGLERLPKQDGPKFVFVHLVSPHRPFVFDSAGNPVSDDYEWDRSSLGLQSYARGYREQLAFLNRRIERVLQTILTESEIPPVILLQADHGPEEGSSQDRMRILNAYYLPDGRDYDRLYSSITPVNSFRVVLDAVLGGRTALLEDRSFFSSYQDPFEYQQIPNECSQTDRLG